MDIQYFLALFGISRDKLSKFNWMNLAPEFKLDRYEHSRVGIEPTWGRNGIGLGVGLGRFDLWFGWPKHEDLHRAGCGHGGDPSPVDD
jgi:hypothetical protein